MELCIGKHSVKFKKLCYECNYVYTKTAFTKKVNEFKIFLISMSDLYDKDKDSDLLNIRDEILGDFNQVLYFLRMP